MQKDDNFNRMLNEHTRILAEPPVGIYLWSDMRNNRGIPMNVRPVPQVRKFDEENLDTVRRARILRRRIRGNLKPQNRHMYASLDDS